MSVKRNTTERFRDKTSYGLFCVNIHGSALNVIKDLFKQQVNTGLRRTLFVLDLNEVQNELNKQPRNSKMKRELKENYNSYLINAILQQIQGLRKEYELLTKKINEELKFDLYQHWLKECEDLQKRNILQKTADTKEKVTEIKPAKVSKQQEKMSCNSALKAKEHNRVGQPVSLSKRKYIKDEPFMNKLYIILLDQMSENFYVDLLRRDQPLEGIINFVPTESNYDIMLGNNKLRNFIAATLETINSSNYKLRQEALVKPVGLFTHQLPVISYCLATKHAREIYDQLTWSIYDVDMLRQQYEFFYYKPFQMTDVGIPAKVNLTELYYEAESFSIQGYFQKRVLPACSTDLATIAAYLNSLLNTCGLPHVITDSADTNSNLSLHRYKLRKCFSTVTKIPKYNRLIVDENNKLLINMIKYADTTNLKSMYLCCLDYDVVRKYVIFPTPQLNYENCKHFKHFSLPKYVKYYANEDCSKQRLTELLKEFDDYQLQEISPGYKLYTFRRCYNELREYEGSAIIPTRLCFRDFTLFQMEEFFQHLTTPKADTLFSSDLSSNEKKLNTLEFDENIFVRPNSLKALKLQTVRSSGENKSRKSDSRSNRSKNEKKSSLSKTTIKNADTLGFTTDHPLLKGYNLEDTLQEIKYKISKYYYQQGFIQLYEERWCFRDMNKQLTLSIHHTTIFFNRPRHQIEGISNNIRLITHNNISLRILNDFNECSKIVMNYPNGLGIFHHMDYCEQVWYCVKTPQNEKRRIYTSLGAIIVFFKSHSMIMIMRYNGEVYRLYQHELVEEEEEQEDFTSDLDDVQGKSSKFADTKAWGDSFLNSKLPEPHKTNTNSTTNANKPKRYKNHLNEDCVTNDNNSFRSAIHHELNFLNLICSTYDLNYVHLIITTSKGMRINVIQQKEIYQGHHCSIKEWHDYFTNESFCERSDGVKMIWTQEFFKCFHQDGSIFKTTIEQDFATEVIDDFDTQVSQSSSHNNLEKEIKEKKDLKVLEKSTSSSTYAQVETAEECIIPVIPFTRYSCNSCLMQHQFYAGVYTLNSKGLNSMEILGIDYIRICTYSKPSFGDDNFSECDTLRSEGEEYTKDTWNEMARINVWIGEDLQMSIDKEFCEISAVMKQTTFDKKLKSDSLTLRLKYTDCVQDVFKYLVNKIALFEQNNQQKPKTLFYIEKINNDSSIRGFEFFTLLPLLSTYNCRFSNNITELNRVATINELMTHYCEWHKEDMKKFPQKHLEETNNFPIVLTANIFIEIPKQLQCTSNITKFLEPFENINFKKLRGKFKQVFGYHLKPQQQYDLKLFSCKKSWQKHRWEHDRRLFMEKQRLSLYHAMYKHKTYPDYWKFTQAYKGKVHGIEFFDFMQNKCENKNE